MKRSYWVKRFKFLITLVIVTGIFLSYPQTTKAGIYDSNTEITYKEYWAEHTPANYIGTCGSTAISPWGIEPTNTCPIPLTIDIPDNFSQALMAEIYIDLWNNHSNGARFQVNSAAPLYQPTSKTFTRVAYITEIPLTDLITGSNVITFSTPNANGYHVRDVAIRIFYDTSNPLIAGPGSDVTPPDGQLTSITASNGTFTPTISGTLAVDDDQLILSASSTATDTQFIEFHGYYYGYDEDDDGVLLDWHNLGRHNYHSGGTYAQPQGGTINHIGTDTSSPYSVNWQIPHIINQSGVRFKIRIVDTAGNVREAAGGISAPFTLTRTDLMEAYTIPGFADAGLHYGGTFANSINRFITLPSDLSDLYKAYIIGAYWHNPFISINDNPQFLAFDSGDERVALSVQEIPISYLQSGSNKITYIYNPAEILFGQNVEKPGPMIVLRRSDPDFSVTRQSLIFSGVAGAENPRIQRLGILNTGGGPINWSISSNNNPGWLNIYPSSGQNDRFPVFAVDTTGLSSGVYTDTLVVSASETTITETIVVSLTVSPSSLSFYQNDFESYASGSDPVDWFDTQAFNSLAEDDSLFKVFDISGNKVLGTTSIQTNIHSHYTGLVPDDYHIYEYSGRMRMTAANGGIGVTFLSQYPNNNTYYRLRRYGSNSFHLAQFGTNITGGTTDTGVVPVPNTWYRFRIQVEDTGSRTEIRARVWLDGSSEPTLWQIEAYDDSASRMVSGTFGVWSFSNGSKYWDDINVTPLPSPDALYSNDMSSYAVGANPDNWLDTTFNNSLIEADALFGVADVGGERVFGTTSTQTNIHSHYVGAASHAFMAYEYSGRMRITAVDSGIGVTFLSQYPDNTSYYRLRRYGSTAFHLSSFGTSITGGTTNTGIVPAANTWYRFRIQVEDTGSRTEIRARVWLDGATEPTTWQIDAYDDSASRLVAGTFGVWSFSNGSKYWDDFAVSPLPLGPTAVSLFDFKPITTQSTQFVLLYIAFIMMSIMTLLKISSLSFVLLKTRKSGHDST